MVTKLLLATFLVISIASHSTQCLRFPRHAKTDLKTVGVVTDLDKFMKVQSDIAGNSFANDTKWPSELQNFRQKSLWTDCVFKVGQDGKDKEIEAHAAVLAIASPVLKLALKTSSRFRLKEWQPSEFETIIRMIYSGDTCFKNVDEACNLMKLAKGLKLGFVFDAAQRYIQGHMYPDRYWDAFICARQTSAGKLLQAVNQVINANTSKFMKDPGFKKISNAELANILARDDITVKSEVELYTFVMNWALAQVKKSGQRASDEALKKTIGFAALKNIRFLTMTALEFTTLHNILDYEGSLAVRQNILNPGIMEMPEYLSSSRIKRKEIVDATEETFTGVVLDEKCEGYSEKKSVYDHLTTLSIYTCPYKLVGIQIPKSLESRNDCQVKEHFDVLILNPENEVVYKHTFNQAPSCTSLRRVKDGVHYRNVNDNKLIDVKFKELIDISKSDSRKPWRVKVIFHDTSKKYPLHVHSGYESEIGWARCTSDEVDFMGSPGYTNYFFKGTKFVYGFYVKGSKIPC